jgi:hypothetical protein
VVLASRQFVPYQPIVGSLGLGSSRQSALGKIEANRDAPWTSTVSPAVSPDNRSQAPHTPALIRLLPEPERDLECRRNR